MFRSGWEVKLAVLVVAIALMVVALVAVMPESVAASNGSNATVQEQAPAVDASATQPAPTTLQCFFGLCE